MNISRRDLLKLGTSFAWGALAASIPPITDAALDYNAQMQGVETSTEFKDITTKLEQHGLAELSELFSHITSLAETWGIKENEIFAPELSGYKKLVELVIGYTKDNKLDELAKLMQIEPTLPDSEEIDGIVNDANFSFERDEPYNNPELVKNLYKSLLKTFPILAPVLRKAVGKMKIESNLERNEHYHAGSYFIGAETLLPGLYVSADLYTDRIIDPDIFGEHSRYLFDRLQFIGVSEHEIGHHFEGEEFVGTNHFSREIAHEVGLKNYTLLLNAKLKEVLTLSQSLFNPDKDFIRDFQSNPKNMDYFDSWMLGWPPISDIKDYLHKILDRFDLLSTDLSSDPAVIDILTKFNMYIQKQDRTQEEGQWIGDNNIQVYEAIQKYPVNQIKIFLENNNKNCNGYDNCAISGLHLLLLSKYKQSRLSNKNNIFVTKFNQRQFGEIQSLCASMIRHIFHRQLTPITQKMIMSGDLNKSPEQINQYSTNVDQIARENLLPIYNSINGFKSNQELYGAIRKFIFGIDIVGNYTTDIDKKVLEYLKNEFDINAKANYNGEIKSLKNRIFSFYKNGQVVSVINLNPSGNPQDPNNRFMLYNSAERRIDIVRTSLDKIFDAPSSYTTIIN